MHWSKTFRFRHIDILLFIISLFLANGFHPAVILLFISCPWFCSWRFIRWPKYKQNVVHGMLFIQTGFEPWWYRTWWQWSFVRCTHKFITLCQFVHIRLYKLVHLGKKWYDRHRRFRVGPFAYPRQQKGRWIGEPPPGRHLCSQRWPNSSLLSGVRINKHAFFGLTWYNSYRYVTQYN